MAGGGIGRNVHAHPGAGQRSSILPAWFANLLIFGLSAAGSLAITSRFGTHMFLIVLVSVFAGTIYAVISFRNVTVPFFVWLLAVGGFRYLVNVQAPVLPDLFLDRLSMIWLAGVFVIKFVSERRSLRGPFALDWLLLANAVYILLAIIGHEMVAFHEWTMSILIPYAAYYFAKNIVISRKLVRIHLGILLVLLAYYGITSIAEKFNITWLIWPKYILTSTAWVGRSGGPFLHGPLFGTIIGMMLPLNLYFLATTKSYVAKSALYVNFALGLAGLYFTYTRGSWLAGIAALGAVSLLNGRRYLRILAPAAVLIPVIAFSFLGLGQDKFMKSRVENEDTVGGRIATMVTAVRMWRDNPLLGVGFYQYRFNNEAYVKPVEAPLLGTIRVAQFRHNPPHDIYFAYLAENGLIGVGLQWAIYIIIFRSILRVRRRRTGTEDEFADLVVPVLAGMFVGYMVGGLAIDYKFFSVVGTLFYTSAGILYGYRPEDYLRGEVSEPPVPAAPSSPDGGGHTGPRFVVE